jgi:hypothetical protein
MVKKLAVSEPGAEKTPEQESTEDLQQIWQKQYFVRPFLRRKVE